MTKINVTCPVCEHVNLREVPNMINIADQPTLYDDFVNNKVFQFECEQCGASRRINAPLTVYNPEKKYTVVSLSDQTLDSQDELMNALQSMTPNGYDLSDWNMRIVRTLPDLIEKVTLFEADYNDEIVEMVKFLSDGLVAKEQDNLQIRARYFTLINQKPKILYITTDGQYTADYHEKLVDFIKDKYGRFTGKYPLGEYQVIDANWAYHLIEYGTGNPDLDTKKDN